MTSRRSFLSSAGLAGGAAVLAVKPVQASNPANSVANSVHLSTARILRKHLHKIAANPKHNPFADGELATAFRMHCDALEASGHNKKMRQALRDKGTISTLSTSDLEPHFNTIKQLGINLPDHVIKAVSDQIVQIGNDTSPNLIHALESHSMLKVQRSLHGAMLNIQAFHENQTLQTAYNAKHPVSRFQTAAYETGPAHLQRVTVYEEVTVVAESDGWAGFYGGGDGPTHQGPGMDLPIEEEPGGGGGYTPIYTQDGYTLDFGNILSPTITLPSGRTVQLCELIYATLALGATSAAGAIGILQLMGTTEIIIAGASFNPVTLIIVLGLLAGVFAYYRAYC